MGVRLIVEVLDYAPADLTSSEVVVLLVLAENANDTTRIGWPGMDAVARRTRLSPVGVRKALHRLAERGYEVRVVLGKDKRGKPVYSWPGKRTTYRLPRFADGDTTGSPYGDTTGSPSLGEWRSSEDGMAIQTGQNGDPLVSPVPSSSSLLKSPHAAAAVDEKVIKANARIDAAVAVVMDMVDDVTEEKARTAVKLIIEERNPTHVVNYVKKLADEDVLDEWVERVEAEEYDRWRQAAIARARQMPECEHGTPNGSAINPTTGKSWFCALCRTAAGGADPWDF